MQRGIEFVRNQGINAIVDHERRLMTLLREGLQEIPTVQVYGAEVGHSVGVTSINIAGNDPQEMATVLDQAASVQTRAGFHCAPLMHASLKTDSR